MGTVIGTEATVKLKQCLADVPGTATEKERKWFFLKEVLFKFIQLRFLKN